MPAPSESPGRSENGCEEDEECDEEEVQEEDPANRVGQDDPELPVQDEEEEFVEVAIWPEGELTGFRTAETDSTLRWAMALNWADRLARRPGVFTYRTGRLGQTDGIDINGHETRHQRLQLGERDISDPVTGQVNWNRLPIHKISTIRTEEHAWNWTARAELREHYLVQPRTYLNFDEGSGDYRNLEFAFTNNFGQRTNLELSFWDRRDGDRFARNSMNGMQLSARARHHLNDRVLLRAGYLHNSLDHEQPFGYQVQDPATFTFNPFITVALEPNASSEWETNDLYLELLQRGSSTVPPERGAGLQLQTDRRELIYSRDTTGHAMRDLSLYAWQEWRPGAAVLRVRGQGQLLSETLGRSMPERNYLLGSGELRGELPLGRRLTLLGSGRFLARGDGRSGHSLSGAVRLRPVEGFELEASAAIGSEMPALQALYWSSEEFFGNENLTNEQGVQSALFASWRFHPWLTLGARGGMRQTDSGIFVDEQGWFLNIDRYRTLFGSAWLELDAPRFEGSISSTLRLTESASLMPVNQILDESGRQVMIKGALFWKNYLFNRAAFIKAGASGFITPGGYVPAGFLVPLNRWQHGIEMERLLDFHRLDLEVSARIRWFMLLLRYENVLDGMSQPGYFETGGYPMPGRRFIVGFRILFTN